MISRGRLAALVLLALLAGRPSVSDEPATRPDIVLITLDTTRADRLGCYGYKAAATPNLDALAASGVRFERAQSPSPLTLPSHTTMMSGLVPRRHGVRDNALYPVGEGVPLLAELLAARGYQTLAFVSSAVLDRGAGLARGFEIYDDRVRVGRRSAFNYEERAASQTNQPLFERFERLDRPFFLWVHYFDPHAPYVPPPPFDQRFADRPYDGEIAFMDASIGRLLERLARVAPSATIVVAGDHGESLGDHGEDKHGVFLYQSTQRVPLIVAGPDIPKKKTIEARVGLVDLMPTVLELAGLPIPTGLDGRSLVPLLRGRPPGTSVSYEMESFFPLLAYDWAPLHGLIRDDLVVIDAPIPESYDLRADPGQLESIWPVRGKARRLLRSLRRRTEVDTLPAVEMDEQTRERAMRVASLGYAGGRPPETAERLDPKTGVKLLVELDTARESIAAGRPRDAVGPIRELLSENPGNVTARLSLVAAELGAGRPDAAVAAARTALELRPDDDLVRFNLANALFAESATRPEARREAGEQYEHALRLNPRRAEAYLNYAALLVGAKRPEQALELLARAETAGVEDPDIATERGLLELLRGNAPAAIRYFEQALTLNPDATDAARALERLRRR